MNDIGNILSSPLLVFPERKENVTPKTRKLIIQEKDSKT
jgi:hypothetical protein